jgi:WD40 repeat protein
MSEKYYEFNTIDNKLIKFNLIEKIKYNEKPIYAAKKLFKSLYKKNKINNTTFTINNIKNNKIYGPYIGNYDSNSQKINIQKGGNYVKTIIETNPIYAAKAVTISNDGTIVITGVGYNILIYETSTGNIIKTLTGHTNFINSLALSKNKKFIVSGSKDNTVKIWNIETENCIDTYNYTSSVKCVSISKNDSYIASTNGSYEIHIWNINPNNLDIIDRRTITIDNLIGVNSISLNHDGTQIATGTYNGRVSIFDTSNGNSIVVFNKHTAKVNSVSFSGNGRYLASASSDHTVKVWNVVNRSYIRNYQGHRHEVNTVSFNDDNTTIVSGGRDRRVIIWNLVENRIISVFENEFQINSISINSDATKIAYSESSSIIILNDAIQLHQSRLSKVRSEITNKLKTHPNVITEYLKVINHDNNNFSYNNITKNIVNRTISNVNNANIQSIMQKSFLRNRDQR